MAVSRNQCRCLNRVAILAISTLGSPAFAQQVPAGPPAGAAGQAAPDNALSDIVVTAQRRSERLQNVGIAVAAFSGEALRQAGISSATDLAQITPGVFVSGSVGGQTQQFTVRGVTQSDFSDYLESPVAFYVDDVYVPVQQGQNIALFDIERVEVLKGPQGTLFGRNATGGLVQNIVSKPLIGITTGYASSTYGRFDAVKEEAALNLPLGSSAAFRVSGYYSRQNNFWKNAFPAGVAPGFPTDFGSPGIHTTPRGQDVGGGDTFAGRAQVLLEPSKDLSIRLSLSGSQQNLSTAAYESVATIAIVDSQGRVVGNDRVGPNETRLAIGPGGVNANSGLGFAIFPMGGTRVPGSTWFGYNPSSISAKDLVLSQDFSKGRGNSDSSWVGSAHVDYRLGSIDLASVTAYQEHRKAFYLDIDGSPTNFGAYGTRAFTRVFSEELRLSGQSNRLRWTAGAYYLHINAHNLKGIMGPKGSFYAGLFGAANSGLDAPNDVHLTTDSASVFGQAEYDITNALRLVVGGRLLREHQDYSFSTFAAANVDDYQLDTTPLFPLQPSFQDARTNLLWAGKAQLELRPANNLLIYAGINRGVKGGAYNARDNDGSPPLDPGSFPYRAEVLYNYEAGIKYSTRVISGAISAYYYDYRNYQAFLYVNTSGTVQNVPAKVSGLDANFTLRATSFLRLEGGGSYSHGSIDNFQVAPGVFRTVRPTYAPRTQLFGGGTVTIPPSILGGTVTATGNVSYSSGFYYNIRNFNGEWFGGHTITNFNIDWQNESGLSIGVFLKNSFDSRYKLIGFDLSNTCGCSIEAYGPPRTYGLSLAKKF